MLEIARFSDGSDRFELEFRATALPLRIRLLYSIWRAVDLLVQVKLTAKYEHSPIVTADNTL
jgi:hypothetical protein